MGKVRLLFTADGAALGERVALALQEQGVGLSFGLFDEGDLDPRPVTATIVIWTAQARASSDILLACDNAMAARSLVPIGGSGQAPEAFAELAPINLSGWTGDVDDPRWRFVLDELSLAGRRGEVRNTEEDVRNADQEASAAAAPIASIEVASATAASAPRRNTSAPRSQSPFRKRLAARPNVAAIAAGFAASLMVTGGAAFIAGVSAYRAGPALAANAPDAPASMRTLTASAPPAAAADPALSPAASSAAPIAAFIEPSPAAKLAMESGGDIAGDASGAEQAESAAAQEALSSDDVIGRLAWATTSQTGDAAVEEIVSSTSSANEADGAVDDPTVLAAAAIPEAPEDPLEPDVADALGATLPEGAFRDCDVCPALVVAPAGAFAIGSPAGEAARTYDEYVVSDVEMPTAYAIGVHEVTFAQWDACVSDGGCRGYRPSDVGWGRGARPVVNVSFEDAQGYVDWLSRRTGHAYRLPSEAEWEYAARAKANGPFGFGHGLSPERANYHGSYPYDGPKGVYRRKTTPVGAFAANAFGLYDVHGNVWEWTADCWMAGARVPDPGAKPVDAGAGGDCSKRVVKGGAWSTGGWRLRAAHREATPTAARNFSTGFRVVRAAPEG
ncbi:MAG: formylglycine-generating enzyme family protein [Pseudomonadota bacterium]